jgi:hypothetical protein
MKRQDMLMKSKIRKKTECTVFLDTVTMIAEITAIIEKV